MEGYNNTSTFSSYGGKKPMIKGFILGVLLICSKLHAKVCVIIGCFLFKWIRWITFLSLAFVEAREKKVSAFSI